MTMRAFLLLSIRCVSPPRIGFALLYVPPYAVFVRRDACCVVAHAMRVRGSDGGIFMIMLCWLHAAARRAGIETLILPSSNREEWENLPASVREHLTIHFVDTFDNVIEKVFDL